MDDVSAADQITATARAIAEQLDSTLEGLLSGARLMDRTAGSTSPRPPSSPPGLDPLPALPAYSGSPSRGGRMGYGPPYMVPGAGQYMGAVPMSGMGPGLPYMGWGVPPLPQLYGSPSRHVSGFSGSTGGSCFFAPPSQVLPGFPGQMMGAPAGYAVPGSMSLAGQPPGMGPSIFGPTGMSVQAGVLPGNPLYPPVPALVPQTGGSAVVAPEVARNVPPCGAPCQYAPPFANWPGLGAMPGDGLPCAMNLQQPHPSGSHQLPTWQLPSQSYLQGQPSGGKLGPYPSSPGQSPPPAGLGGDPTEVDAAELARMAVVQSPPSVVSSDVSSVYDAFGRPYRSASPYRSPGRSDHSRSPARHKPSDSSSPRDQYSRRSQHEEAVRPQYSSRDGSRHRLQSRHKSRHREGTEEEADRKLHHRPSRRKQRDRMPRSGVRRSREAAHSSRSRSASRSKSRSVSPERRTYSSSGGQLKRRMSSPSKAPQGTRPMSSPSLLPAASQPAGALTLHFPQQPSAPDAAAFAVSIHNVPPPAAVHTARLYPPGIPPPSGTHISSSPPPPTSSSIMGTDQFAGSPGNKQGAHHTTHTYHMPASSNRASPQAAAVPLSPSAPPSPTRHFAHTQTSPQAYPQDRPPAVQAAIRNLGPAHSSPQAHMPPPTTGQGPPSPTPPPFHPLQRAQPHVSCQYQDSVSRWDPQFQAGSQAGRAAPGSVVDPIHSPQYQSNGSALFVPPVVPNLHHPLPASVALGQPPDGTQQAGQQQYHLQYGGHPQATDGTQQAGQQQYHLQYGGHPQATAQPQHLRSIGHQVPDLHPSIAHQPRLNPYAALPSHGQYPLGMQQILQHSLASSTALDSLRYTSSNQHKHDQGTATGSSRYTDTSQHPHARQAPAVSNMGGDVYTSSQRGFQGHPVPPSTAFPAVPQPAPGQHNPGGSRGPWAAAPSNAGAGWSDVRQAYMDTYGQLEAVYSHTGWGPPGQ